MGWRYRKSIHVGGGMRINISNSGVGFSYGIKGFRQSVMPNGRVRTTISIPGTGISYVEEQKVGNQQLEQEGTYAEYRTSVINMDTSEVFQALADHCNAWMRRMWKSLCFLIIELFAIIALSIWLVNYEDTFEASIKIILLAFGGIFGVIDAINKYRGSRITMDYDLPNNNAEYIGMLNFIKQLGTSRKLEQIYGHTDGLRRRTNAGASTNLSLRRTRISQSAPMMITTNAKCYHVRLMRNKLFFFPDMVILIERGKMRILRYEDISVQYSTRDIIDHGRLAYDAEVIGYRWQYSNNDGSPDRRFNNNHQVPVCRNGQLTLGLPNGVELYLIGSNKEAMKNAAHYLQKLCKVRETQNAERKLDNKQDSDL